MNGNQLTAKLGSPPATNALAESDTKFFAMGLEIEFPKVAAPGRRSRQTDPGGGRGLRQPFPGSEAAVRKSIADLRAGKPDENMFAPGGQQFLPQLQSQVSQMGKVKSVTFQSEKGFWAVRIWLAADGKVERAAIQERPQQ